MTDDDSIPRQSRAQDIVGAKLLTVLANGRSVISERHDSLEFIDHVSFVHNVRLTLDFGGLGTAREAWDSDSRPAPNLEMPEVLRLWSNELVVPLMALDRDALANTDVRNEVNELVPTFTREELDNLLGGGLVIWAERVLEGELSDELDDTLRAVPARSSSAGGKQGSNRLTLAYADAVRALNRSRSGQQLLASPPFRAGLRIVTDAEHLIAKVDPHDGRPDRVVSFSLSRTLRRNFSGRPRVRPGCEAFAIPLGALNRCESYRLELVAPHDAWIRRAHLRSERRGRKEIDVKLQHRINHADRRELEAWGQELFLELRCVKTGVSRTSVWAGTFLSMCCILGLIRVIARGDHTFLATNTDAAASVLLLFPGLVASFLAAPARHTLTARLQFPIRLSMWSMCAAGFVLATAAALGVDDTTNIVLWSTITALMLALTTLLSVATARLRQRSGGTSWWGADLSARRGSPEVYAEDTRAWSIEFDTTRAVDEEFWAQEWITRLLADVTDDQFIAEYQAGLSDHYAARQAVVADQAKAKNVRKEIQTTLDAVWWFGEEAARRARHKTMERVVVNFTQPDKKGAVALASQALAREGGNVHGARMSIVGGKLIMTLLLSCRGRTASDAAHRFSDALTAAEAGLSGSRNLAVVPLEAEDASFPRPGSTYWHLVARQHRGADLLVAVTAQLLEHTIVSLTSVQPGRESNREDIVDLIFALPPARGVDATRVAQRVRAQVETAVGDAQVTLSPIGAREATTDRGHDTIADDAVALTIVGRAEPGFIHTALLAVKKHADIKTVYAASTVVLEGIAALTLILPPGDNAASGRDLASTVDLQNAVTSDIAATGRHAHLVRLHGHGEPTDDSPHPPATPTHRVELQVIDQPRVLARVSQIMKEHDANIVWLTSYVLEPLVGENWSRCAITMHVNVPKGPSPRKRRRSGSKRTPEDIISARLRSLADREGWDRVALHPWTVTPASED